ncbi:hypothetical protein [uncultured Nocardioides sp.]|uniref:DUF6994 family protein n=1 Tax=uncultured Nocardioides sp. TaxID=198441 RepID=UPI002634608F|nr:hypothetical protein [uncultured Nocardioides sp.]
MTSAPWLQTGGSHRCFACETASARAGRGGDPDWYSADLRESHRVLWSKLLPSGQPLELETDRSGYLKIVSLPGRHTLGSDNFATTHANALSTLSRGLDDFAEGHLCAFCTIGGYIIFPNGLAQQSSTRVNQDARRWTVNQARGMDRRIADRFDLTLVAISMFYAGTVDRALNPIGDVLEAYRWWFDLFGEGTDGFRNYADFFFLTPLLDVDGSVRPFGTLPLAFKDALPASDMATYRTYVTDQLAFVRARNELIDQWWSHSDG